MSTVKYGSVVFSGAAGVAAVFLNQNSGEPALTVWHYLAITAIAGGTLTSLIAMRIEDANTRFARATSEETNTLVKEVKNMAEDILMEIESKRQEPFSEAQRKQLRAYTAKKLSRQLAHEPKTPPDFSFDDVAKLGRLSSKFQGKQPNITLNDAKSLVDIYLKKKL